MAVGNAILIALSFGLAPWLATGEVIGDEKTTTILALTEEVPKLDVPHCHCTKCRENAGSASPFYITTTDGLVPPVQNVLKNNICWDEKGIQIITNMSDDDVWQNCKKCGCSNYAEGDVAEVFLGPVSSFDKVPRWYLEMDAGAVTGAFWGGIVNNSAGNDNIYPPSTTCTVDAGTGFSSCQMDCSGTLPSVSVAQGSGWWSRTMTVPWSLYSKRYTPDGTADGAPWPTWRGNFYRYSYPFKHNNGTFDRTRAELSGWSPTHNPSFHVPDRFGKLTFLANTEAMRTSDI
eukprot:TRINITY_DN56633_c0_g1_i1.p1 TRINITY_DN56633_c0_g1~~TRINITY_DN56633_c0_g1_i1.p1  ORF type:complete len:289 (-),score=32.25 TRINITY_DN56633_c0_g1_i1:144-1010(-)